MKTRHLLYATLLLAGLGCNSNNSDRPSSNDTEAYEWIALQPGTFDRLSAFVAKKGTWDDWSYSTMYTTPDSMNTLSLSAHEGTKKLMVWSYLPGDTVRPYCPLLMYSINPNDSWTALIVDSVKQEQAIRPIVDSMLVEMGY